MKILMKLMVVLGLSIIFIACDSGAKPVEIEGLSDYKDQVLGFSTKYPKNWSVSSLPGDRFVVFSHQEARKRFSKYDPDGFPGAKYEVISFKLDSNRNFQKVLEGVKVFDPTAYKESSTTIDNTPAMKFTYAFDLTDGMMNGEMYIAQKDSNYATVVRFEAFGDTWEKYKKSFDEMLASVVLASTPAEKVRDTTTILEEAPPPSTNLTEKSGDGFTIMIPDNFQSENVGKSQGALRVYNYMGMRRGDSYIRIETFDASKSKDLKKIVEDNKTKFNATPRETTISGKKSYVMDYKASKDVKGKIWFAIHNDHLYRITINWYAPEEKDFLPPFEKSISTFKFQ